MNKEIKTTIVVATYKGDEYYEKIKSHLKNMRGFDKEFKVLYVDPTKNNTFSENNNIGAKQVKTPYTLFLNSDTEPQPGFIGHMEKALDNKKVAVVGSRLFFLKDSKKKIKFKGKVINIDSEKGKIQHAGIVYNESFMPEEYGRGFSPDDSEVLKNRIVPSVTGACMMVRTKEFLEIGGFDESFKNGWEDTDLCLRFLEKGNLCMYAANSIVGHHFAGSQFQGRFKNEDANFDLWRKKWIESGKIYNIFLGIPTNVKRLDIGCGYNDDKEYYGIDKYHGKGIDFVFNLERIGINGATLPFGDSKIEEIRCFNTLHLLENTIETMNEFHRILNTDGWLYIKVPHAFSWLGISSPFVKKSFLPETFRNYFASDTREEKLKTNPQMLEIKSWHIEELDSTTVPLGIESSEIEREITVKMRPLK